MKKILCESAVNYFKSGLILFIALASACEKDNADAGTIRNVKAWYMKAHEKDRSNITSNNGANNKIDQEPLWNQAQIVSLEDGSDIISVPLQTTISHKRFPKGSFILLITTHGRSFDSRILYSEDDEGFASSEQPIDAIKRWHKMAFDGGKKGHLFNVSSGVPQNKSAFQATISPVKETGIQKLKEKDENCVNWYLVTSYYDGNGFFLYSEEQYLYSTGCAADIGIVSRSGNKEDCGTIQSSIEGETVSENISTSLVQETPVTRKKSYVWKFLKNTFGLWAYHSVEEGVHKKVSGVWQWQSLTHKSVSRTGYVIGASIKVVINSSIPVIGIYYAGMQLNYEFIGEAVCKGFPVATYDTGVANSPVWLASN